MVNSVINNWSGSWSTAPLKELSENEKSSIQISAETLCNRERWNEVVEEFQKMMNEILNKSGKGKQEEIRDRYIIRFSNFDFTGKNTHFASYIFPCNVDFRGAKFDNRNVSFKNAEFMGRNNNFSFIKFGDGGVNFNSAKFVNGDVIFFDGDAIFFDGNVIFHRADFGNGDVNFDNVNFGDKSIDFSSAQFGNGNVDFGGAQFGKGGVKFQEASFGKGNVNFSGANFGKGIPYFYDVDFGEGEISFSETIYKGGQAIFQESQLAKGDFFFSTKNRMETNFYFDGMVIDGNFHFGGDFTGEVTLERLRVAGAASFFNPNKFKKVPSFKYAKFERPPNVSNMEIPKPALEKLNDNIRNPIGKTLFWRFKCTKDIEDVEKYRKLKAMAIAAHDHEKDGEFFSYEMRAKRGWETKDFLGLLFNSFYCAFSDYGQSIVQPAKWMWRSFYICATLYLILILGYIDEFIELFYAPLFALFLSAYNVLPVFGGVLYSPFVPEEYEPWLLDQLNLLPKKGPIVDLVVFIGTAQSIFGIILLFFFLLGFRNKFRLK